MKFGGKKQGTPLNLKQMHRGNIFIGRVWLESTRSLELVVSTTARILRINVQVCRPIYLFIPDTVSVFDWNFISPSTGMMGFIADLWEHVGTRTGP